MIQFFLDLFLIFVIIMAALLLSSEKKCNDDVIRFGAFCNLKRFSPSNAAVYQGDAASRRICDT
jgi:hypothetical protein